MKKIGILGGTFDPPHLGHLIIGQEVLCQLSLDEIWFMPVNIPPHKEQSSKTTPWERKEMVELAIDGNHKFLLSTVELERLGRSYTIDTIQLLQEKHPTFEFYFIIGGDMLQQLHTWHQIDKLLELITFVALKRPKISLEYVEKDNIVILEAPQIDISSSLIRERIAAGKSVRYLIPEPVRFYIKERGLYEEGRSSFDR